MATAGPRAQQPDGTVAIPGDWLKRLDPGTRTLCEMQAQAFLR